MPEGDEITISRWSEPEMRILREQEQARLRDMSVVPFIETQQETGRWAVETPPIPQISLSDIERMRESLGAAAPGTVVRASLDWGYRTLNIEDFDVAAAPPSPRRNRRRQEQEVPTEIVHDGIKAILQCQGIPEPLRNEVRRAWYRYIQTPKEKGGAGGVDPGAKWDSVCTMVAESDGE